MENWIKHDQDSRLKPETTALVNKFGATGYGAYWMMIEELYRCSDHALKIDTASLSLISIAWNIDAVLLSEIVAFCVKAGLFTQSAQFAQGGTSISSSKVNEEIVKRNQHFEGVRAERALAGIKSGAARRTNANKTEQTRTNANKTEQNEPEGDQIRGRVRSEGEESNTGGEGATRQPPQVNTNAPLIDLSETEYKNLVIEFSEDPVKYYLPVCTDWLLSKGKGPPKSGVALLRNWIRKDKAERKGFYYPAAYQPKNGVDPNGYSSAFNRNMEMREKYAKLEAEGKLKDGKDL